MKAVLQVDTFANLELSPMQYCISVGLLRLGVTSIREMRCYSELHRAFYQTSVMLLLISLPFFFPDKYISCNIPSSFFPRL